MLIVQPTNAQTTGRHDAVPQKNALIGRTMYYNWIHQICNDGDQESELHLHSYSDDDISRGTPEFPRSEAMKKITSAKAIFASLFHTRHRSPPPPPPLPGDGLGSAETISSPRSEALL